MSEILTKQFSSYRGYPGGDHNSITYKLTDPASEERGGFPDTSEITGHRVRSITAKDYDVEETDAKKMDVVDIAEVEYNDLGQSHSLYVFESPKTHKAACKTYGDTDYCRYQAGGYVPIKDSPIIKYDAEFISQLSKGLKEAHQKANGFLDSLKTKKGSCPPELVRTNYGVSGEYVFYFQDSENSDNKEIMKYFFLFPGSLWDLSSVPALFRGFIEACRS